MTKIETATVLVLSTAHLFDLDNPDFGNLRSVPHEYGFIVFLGDPISSLEAASLWLKPILELLDADSDCRYLNFDRDGEIYDHLQVWDHSDV